MKKKEVKYSPFTPKDIDIYKKEVTSVPKDKTNLTNLALIQIRKNYLNNYEQNKKLVNNINHFNKVLKSKDLNLIVKLIKNYLKEDN